MKHQIDCLTEKFEHVIDTEIDVKLFLLTRMNLYAKEIVLF